MRRDAVEALLSERVDWKAAIRPLTKGSRHPNDSLPGGGGEVKGFPEPECSLASPHRGQVPSKRVIGLSLSRGHGADRVVREDGRGRPDRVGRADRWIPAETVTYARPPAGPAAPS